MQSKTLHSNENNPNRANNTNTPNIPNIPNTPNASNTSNPEGFSRGNGEGKGGAWFSKAMFWQTINSFCPIPIGYFCILFLALPMDIFMWELPPDRFGIYNNLREYANYGLTFGLHSSFLLGCLSALLVFRYMCNNRSVNMVHSLPIPREALFVTQYLAGLTFVIVPNVAIFILTCLACMVQGILYPEPFLIMCAVNSGLYFFFYSFAVFCAMFTGSVGSIAIFYLASNFFVAFMTLLIQPLFEVYYMGYYDTIFSYPFVQLLTPVYSLAFGAKVEYSVTTSTKEINDPGGYFNLLPENISYYMEDMEVFIGYLVVACVFAGVSLWLYKHRHIEYAGEAVAVAQLKPVFRFIVAILGGLSVGLLTVTFMVDSLYEVKISYLLPVFSILWGVAFTLIAEMVLQKSFTVWREWKKTGVTVGALVLIFAVLYFDLTGFEQRIPEYEQVDYLGVQGVSFYPMDSMGRYIILSQEAGNLTPEAYELVTEMHRLALGVGLARGKEPVVDWERENSSAALFDYVLSDGSTLTRYYAVPYLYEEWREDGYAQVAHQLFNLKEVQEVAYDFDTLVEHVTDVKLDGIPQTRSDSVASLYRDYSGGKGISSFFPDLSVKEMEVLTKQLALAVQQDFEEGNIGEKFLTQKETAYLEDGLYLRLQFDWEYSEDSVTNQKLSYSGAMSTDSVSANATISNSNANSNATISNSSGVTTSAESFSASPEPLGDDHVTYKSGTVMVALTRHAEHTMGVLEEYGFMEEYHIYSNMEVLEEFMEWYKEEIRVNPEVTKDFPTIKDEEDPLSYLFLLR